MAKKTNIGKLLGELTSNDIMYFKYSTTQFFRILIRAQTKCIQKFK